MNYTPHFSKSEMHKTATGLSNVPDAAAEANLSRLCRLYLEPLRALAGPIVVNSGYRSAEVNAAVGGSRSSAHLHGRAADIYAVSLPLTHLWAHVVLCDGHLSIPGFGGHMDQAIYYVRPAGKGWIHLGIAEAGGEPRRQTLVSPKEGVYMRSGDYTGPWYL
jgi:hypothetical protein